MSVCPGLPEFSLLQKELIDLCFGRVMATQSSNELSAVYKSKAAKFLVRRFVGASQLCSAFCGSLKFQSIIVAQLDTVLSEHSARQYIISGSFLSDARTLLEIVTARRTPHTVALQISELLWSALTCLFNRLYVHIDIAHADSNNALCSQGVATQRPERGRPAPAPFQRGVRETSASRD